MLTGAGPRVEEHVGLTSQNLTGVIRAPYHVVHQPPLIACRPTYHDPYASRTEPIPMQGKTHPHNITDDESIVIITDMTKDPPGFMHALSPNWTPVHQGVSIWF